MKKNEEGKEKRWRYPKHSRRQVQLLRYVEPLQSLELTPVGETRVLTARVVRVWWERGLELCTKVYGCISSPPFCFWLISLRFLCRDSSSHKKCTKSCFSQFLRIFYKSNTQIYERNCLSSSFLSSTEHFHSVRASWSGARPVARIDRGWDTDLQWFQRM
jgi:hypothetical protein